MRWCLKSVLHAIVKPLKWLGIAMLVYFAAGLGSLSLLWATGLCQWPEKGDMICSNRVFTEIANFGLVAWFVFLISGTPFYFAVLGVFYVMRKALR